MILLYMFLVEETLENTNNLNSNKSINKKVSEDSNKMKNDDKSLNLKSYQVQPIKEVTDKIKVFNIDIANDLSHDKNSKSKAINKLISKQRANSSDVVDTINDYYEDISKHQIEIDKLIGNCKRANETILGFEKVISDSNATLSEEAFNQYYFFQGLINSGICKDVGTHRDPFFVILSSARKGDMLSRLLLTDHLYKAIQRKVIDTWKYPQEYMQIRDEAVMYLKQLAAKGVTRASVRLAQLYSYKSIALPPNMVLEYYYSYLALKQEEVEAVYVQDPDSIYKRLTDRQKVIVDRMTANL